MERMRRETGGLLADVLEEAVVALGGGGQHGRTALEWLQSENAAAAERQGVAGAPRTLFGWDSEMEMPREVLRLKREDADEDSSSSSSDEDDDAPVDGARNRKQKKLGPVRVEWAGVAELESEKLEAIHTAIEVAGTLMGVDAVITDTR